MRSLPEAVDALNRPDEAPLAASDRRPRPQPPASDDGDLADVRGQLLRAARARGRRGRRSQPAADRTARAPARRCWRGGCGDDSAAADLRRGARVHGDPLRGGHAAAPAPGLLTERPFRAPHHTISNVALVGGGAHSAPGRDLARAQRRAVPRRDAGVRSPRARSAAPAARRRPRHDRPRRAHGGLSRALRAGRGDEPVPVRLPRRRPPRRAAARPRRSRAIAAGCPARCAIASTSSSRCRPCPWPRSPKARPARRRRSFASASVPRGSVSSRGCRSPAREPMPSCAAAPAPTSAGPTPPAVRSSARGRALRTERARLRPRAEGRAHDRRPRATTVSTPSTSRRRCSTGWWSDSPGSRPGRIRRSVSTPSAGFR